MKKDRYLNTDLYIVEDDIKNVRLLQSSLAKLSTFRCNEGAIKSITNCSFFSTKFVLGRNQGDEKNDTYADQDNLKYADVVIFENGDYRYGYMNNYDFRDNVVCGFSAGAILISEGEDCELYSSPITDIVNIIKTKSPRTAFAITKQGKAIQFVSEGRNTDDKGLTGFEVRDYMKSHYDIEMLAILDGGGSTELINGNIINYLSDGGERPMLNGLAFIDTSFKPRTSVKSPTDMNTSPYYNNALYVGKNNYYKGNKNYQCVAYANARSSEIAKKPITYWSGTSEKKDIEKPLFNRYGFGNAISWLEDTNWSHGTEPKVGAIMVYGSDYGDGLGHVRIVEKIEGNILTISAANENKQMAFKAISKPSISKNGFLGYIYNPYLEEDIEETEEKPIDEAKISQLEEEIKSLTDKLFEMEKERNEALLKIEQYKTKEDKIRSILNE